jgi:hypothetical protein
MQNGVTDFERMVRAKCARREMIEHLCSLQRLSIASGPVDAAAFAREVRRLRKRIREAENVITAEYCFRLTHPVRGWNPEWCNKERMSLRSWVERVEAKAAGAA